MIMTGENRITLRKTCLHAFAHHKPPIWTGLGLNPGLPGERPDEIEARTSVSLLSMLKFVKILVNNGSNTLILKLDTGQDVQPV